MEGTVECDASVMDGATALYGGVGCVEGVRNPIQVAQRLLVTQQTSSLSHGRIQPRWVITEVTGESYVKKNKSPSTC
jgi:taspase (threonine aspartase 1)